MKGDDLIGRLAESPHVWRWLLRLTMLGLLVLGVLNFLRVFGVIS